MPATQTVYHHGLEFEVKPNNPPDPVYFTYQTPQFEIQIRNKNPHNEWDDNCRFGWNLVVDGETVQNGTEIFGPLDEGETTTTTILPGVLAYEGHGVVEIYCDNPKAQVDTDRVTLNSTHGRYNNPAYSFSVWDESHYEATVRRPKQLQTGIIISSVVLILFALIQIIVASGFL